MRAVILHSRPLPDISGGKPSAERTRGCPRLEHLLFARRRGLVIAAFAIVTLAMAWLAAGLRVDAGFTKLVPLEHEYMRTFVEYRDEFGGADRVIIALMAREGDMFTPEFFAALREVTDATFFLPGVDRTQVFSILTPNVRFIEVVEDGIAAGNVLPEDFEPSEAGFARVREKRHQGGRRRAPRGKRLERRNRERQAAGVSPQHR